MKRLGQNKIVDMKHERYFKLAKEYTETPARRKASIRHCKAKPEGAYQRWRKAEYISVATSINLIIRVSITLSSLCPNLV